MASVSLYASIVLMVLIALALVGVNLLLAKNDAAGMRSFRYVLAAALIASGTGLWSYVRVLL